MDIDTIFSFTSVTCNHSPSRCIRGSPRTQLAAHWGPPAPWPRPLCWCCRTSGWRLETASSKRLKRIIYSSISHLVHPRSPGVWGLGGVSRVKIGSSISLLHIFVPDPEPVLGAGGAVLGLGARAGLGVRGQHSKILSETVLLCTLTPDLDWRRRDFGPVIVPDCWSEPSNFVSCNKGKLSSSSSSLSGSFSSGSRLGWASRSDKVMNDAIWSHSIQPRMVSSSSSDGSSCFPSTISNLDLLLGEFCLPWRWNIVMLILIAALSKPFDISSSCLYWTVTPLVTEDCVFSWLLEVCQQWRGRPPVTGGSVSRPSPPLTASRCPWPAWWWGRHCPRARSWWRSACCSCRSPAFFHAHSFWAPRFFCDLENHKKLL